MGIPDFQACFMPILTVLAAGGQLTSRDLVVAVSDHFGLSDLERRELLPSGNQEIINNRVGWAKTYLKKAGLVDSPKKGFVVITEEGRKVVQAKPAAINVRYLKDRYANFREFHQARPRDEQTDLAQEAEDRRDSLTPEEQVEASHLTLRQTLVNEIQERLRGCSPQRFERLVVEVMVAMGYGGSLKDAGEAIGGSGDEGVDGVIKEDRLGLDLIYLQAKRWRDGNTVGRPELQKFVGALDGKRAHKGVFITTSTFTADAITYAEATSRRLILIDGRRLADLMIDHNVGVATLATYTVKRIDSDFFADE
jgi:restriction system protein